MLVSAMAKEAPAKGGRSRLPLILSLSCIVLLAGVIVYLVFFRDTEPEPEGRTLRDVVVAEDTVGEIMDEMMSREPVRAGNYIATMTNEWHFPNGKSASADAYVENDPSNNSPVYFDLELEETGEILYESPVLPLGTHIENFALDKELSQGTYPCVIVYHLIDDEQNTLSTLRIRVNVIVEA